MGPIITGQMIVDFLINGGFAFIVLAIVCGVVLTLSDGAKALLAHRRKRQRQRSTAR